MTTERSWRNFPTGADSVRPLPGSAPTRRRPARGHVQVSTVDQSCERQLRDLAAFAERGGLGVVATFSETASGAKDSHRERKRVLALAQERRIDAVLVTLTSPNRSGRALRVVVRPSFRALANGPH